MADSTEKVLRAANKDLWSILKRVEGAAEEINIDVRLSIGNAIAQTAIDLNRVENK